MKSKTYFPLCRICLKFFEVTRYSQFEFFEEKMRLLQLVCKPCRAARKPIKKERPPKKVYPEVCGECGVAIVPHPLKTLKQMSKAEAIRRVERLARGECQDCGVKSETRRCFKCQKRNSKNSLNAYYRRKKEKNV